MGQLDNSCVYINKVGTFGVNCASYWWTRVAACGIRATHHLLGRCPIDMLLYADDLESLATTRRGRIAIVCYLTALGYPLNGPRPGGDTGWSGSAWNRLGLTEKRAGWLVAWLREKSQAGNVTAKEMAGTGQTRICRNLSGLGEALPRTAICLVLRYPGPSGSHDDTRHAEGPFQLAGR